MGLYSEPMIIAFLLLLLTSCSPAKQVWKQQEDDPLRKLITEHALEQNKRHELELIASGAPTDDNIDRFALHFITYKKVKVPKARCLIVTTIEEFLNKINRDESIQDLLKKHPITVENIRFNIGFAKHDGTFEEPPNIAYAYLKDDKICYCYYDNLFGKFTEYDDIEESYHIAKQMVLE